jgi:cytochrome b6-f complex iron-sulfur subunit
LHTVTRVTIPLFEPEQRTRREFCAYACHALSLTALAAIAQGCSSPTSPSDSAPGIPAASGSIAGGAMQVTVDSSSPLSTIGGAALIENSAGKFLVAHTATDTFVTVTAVCTHEGCTITGYTNQIYVCPCHGSRFNTSGSVISGPASRALRTYATSFANGIVTIAL